MIRGRSGRRARSEGEPVGLIDELTGSVRLRLVVAMCGGLGCAVVRYRGSFDSNRRKTCGIDGNGCRCWFRAGFRTTGS